jgi:hypothetical protein
MKLLKAYRKAIAALHKEARPLAFDAHLFEQGERGPHFENDYLEYTELQEVTCYSKTDP